MAASPVVEAVVEESEAEPEPEEVVAAPAPPAPEPPKLDTAAVARSEAALDEASRDRARAEARTDAAQQSLSKAANQAALEAAKARKLAFRVRDPSTQIARASAKGGFLKAERDSSATRSVRCGACLSPRRRRS